MKENELVYKLSQYYGFDPHEAFTLLDIEINKVPSDISSRCTIDDFKNLKKCSEIKPFDGIILEKCCKAVVYNHGLYTQCTNECNREFCSSVCKRLKYGHINVRKNYPVGSYVLENGKKEINYQKVKKRLEKKNNLDNAERIITDDSDDEGGHAELEMKKNPRGRPKMPHKQIDIQIDSRENDRCDIDCDENIEEVLVRRKTIDGIEYLVSEQNVVFDAKTYKMVGRYILGKIKYI